MRSALLIAYAAVYVAVSGVLRFAAANWWRSAALVGWAIVAARGMEPVPVVDLTNVEYVGMQPSGRQSPPVAEAAPAVELPASLPDSVTRWRDIIHWAADKHGVDPVLVAMVMLQESRGDPEAVSSAGALGLMQVVPRWHPQINDGLGPFDPPHNIDVGVGILADNLRTCGTVRGALAMYNGGQCQPVYDETRRYVAAITSMYGE